MKNLTFILLIFFIVVFYSFQTTTYNQNSLKIPVKLTLKNEQGKLLSGFSVFLFENDPRPRPCDKKGDPMHTSAIENEKGTVFMYVNADVVDSESGKLLAFFFPRMKKEKVHLQFHLTFEKSFRNINNEFITKCEFPIFSENKVDFPVQRSAGGKITTYDVDWVIPFP